MVSAWPLCQASLLSQICHQAFSQKSADVPTGYIRLSSFGHLCIDCCRILPLFWVQLLTATNSRVITAGPDNNNSVWIGYYCSSVHAAYAIIHGSRNASCTTVSKWLQWSVCVCVSGEDGTENRLSRTFRRASVNFRACVYNSELTRTTTDTLFDRQHRDSQLHITAPHN